MPCREDETSAAVAIEENTRALRRRVLKGAHVAFNQEFSSIPCALRNISDTGTRLEFEDGWFVPDRFWLFVDVDGYKVECDRVWQKGKNCGVHFVGPKIPTSSHRQQKLKEYHPPEQLAGRSVVPPSAAPVAHQPAERKGAAFGKRTPGKP